MLRPLFSSVRRLSIPLFFAFALSGCPHLTTRVPERLDEYAVLEPAEREALTTHLAASAAAIKSFRGLATAVIEHFPGKEQGRQVVLFSRPSEMRLETFEPAVNRLVSLVTVNDGMLRAVVTKEKRAYVGDASPEILERFVFLPLSPDAVMLLLVGRLNPEELPAIDAHGFSAQSVQWRKSKDDDSYLLYAPLRSGSSTIEAIFKKGNSSGGSSARENELLLQELLLYDRDTRKLRVKVVYSYPDATGVVPNPAGAKTADTLITLPEMVRVELPQKQAALELQFTETKLNLTIPAERFGLAIPPGLEVVQLLKQQ